MIDRLQHSLKLVRAAKSKLVAKVRRLEQTIEAKDEMFEELQRQVVYRPGSRNVSLYAGFSLACRRNLAHCSERGSMLMLASPEVHGSLKDPHIISRYQVKAALADRIRLRRHAEARDLTLLPRPSEPAELHPVAPQKCYEFIEYKGDDTNQNAIQKHKLRNGTAFFCSFGKRSIMGAFENGKFDIRKFELMWERGFCDLCIVDDASSEGAYKRTMKQLQSVFCPTVDDRVNQAGTSASSDPLIQHSVLHSTLVGTTKV